MESGSLEDSTNGFGGFLEDETKVSLEGDGDDAESGDDEFNVAKRHKNRRLKFKGRWMGVDIESGEVEIEVKRAII